MRWIALLLMLIFVQVGHAASPALRFASPQLASVEHIHQQTKIDEQRIKWLQEEINHIKKQSLPDLQDYIIKGVAQDDLNHAAVIIANIQARIGNLKIALVDINEAKSMSQAYLLEINERIQTAGYLAKEKRTLLLQKLDNQQTAVKAYLIVQKQLATVINQLLELANERLDAWRDWKLKLQKAYKSQEQDQHIKTLYAKAQALQRAQQDDLKKLISLQNSLRNLNLDLPKAIARRVNLDFSIFITQERISIARLQLLIIQLRARQPLIIVDPTAMRVSDLHMKNQQAKNILSELGSVQTVIKDKISLINMHYKIINDSQQQGLISHSVLKAHGKTLRELVISYLRLSRDIGQFSKQLKDYQKQIDESLKAQFAVRQTLPGLDVPAWLKLISEIFVLPKLLWHAFEDALVQLGKLLQVLPSLWLTIFFAFGAALVVSWFFLRKSFLPMLEMLDESSQRFSSRVLTVLLRLIRRNLGTLFVVIILLALWVFFAIDVKIWLFIVLVFLAYRIASILTRLWLLESEADVRGKDVRLYHGLQWIFAIAAILTIITVLAHWLPVAYEVRILFNKLFMLLLLFLSLVLFRAWPVLPSLIRRALNVRRKYIVRAVNLVVWVLPITLFSNAVIGLVGYIDLAWAMGKVQAILLAIFAVYMIIRGLLIDFMEMNYNLVIRYVKTGWLWAQAIVRPLDKIFRISLFLLMLWYIGHVFGLDENVVFIASMKKIFTTKLITLVGNVVTLWFIIKVILFIAILNWFTKWSREFAFRWLYVRAKDVGVRHSLAVFTQYAVVIIGIIIGLRILGIDLRGFAVVAAAFAAAAGFGLRDVIANFFSGVILLAERPFRTGDIISLGTYEGEVLSTGIRSMKIRTWDRMDVIVPNMDVFTKPFTNWTHQDAIVRSVMRINIDRRDDPHRVQQLILGVLIELSSVMDDPEPQVFMKEMSDSLIELEVRCFLNLQVQMSRARVRSDVLFAIWDCFKQHNINPPYPHYDVHLDNALLPPSQ